MVDLVLWIRRYKGFLVTGVLVMCAAIVKAAYGELVIASLLSVLGIVLLFASLVVGEHL